MFGRRPTRWSSCGGGFPESQLKSPSMTILFATAGAHPAGCFTQTHGILPLFAWPAPPAGAHPALRAWRCPMWDRLLHANTRHPAVVSLAGSAGWCSPGPPGLAPPAWDRLQPVMFWSRGVLRGSGLPAPRRRTFAAAILAFAHSMLTTLRRPWLRLSATPAPGVRATPTEYPLRRSARGWPDRVRCRDFHRDNHEHRDLGLGRSLPPTPKETVTQRHNTSRRSRPRKIRHDAEIFREEAGYCLADWPNPGFEPMNNW
jgi:hypothetical protein